MSNTTEVDSPNRDSDLAIRLGLRPLDAVGLDLVGKDARSRMEGSRGGGGVIVGSFKGLGDNRLFVTANHLLEVAGCGNRAVNRIKFARVTAGALDGRR